jgi:hypothetical protein
MSFFATVAGLQIVSGSLSIPLVGVWTADVALATQNTLPTGLVVVQIGNLSLSGTVYRSESYGGQVKARIVGGYGGWRSSIAAQGYGSPSGVKLSTILQDAAQAAGETVNVQNDTTVGNGFARMAFDTSVASDVLWLLVRLGFIPAWYVDPTGTTQNVAWPSNAVTTPFQVTAQHPEQGMIEIATEDYVSWMPGCTFSAPQLSGTYTSNGVHYVWDGGGKFRFEVLTQTSTAESQDRVLGPIQQIVQKEVADMRLFGRYRYTTSNPTATTVDATPKNSKLGLPDLQNVPLRISGSSKVTPASGADCDIMFADGCVPICCWVDQTPTEVDIASGGNGAGYLGAQVQLFFPPVVTFVSVTPPLSGTMQIVSPLTGIVTQGSSIVKVPS